MEHDKKTFVDCARAKVTEIFKRATPPSDNLTLDERKAIKELKSYNDILM